MRRPRVAFVAPSAYPIGGVATWLEYLVPGLRDRGWESSLALVGGHWHDAERYLDVRASPDTVVIRYSGASEEGRISALVRALGALEPDVVAVVNLPDVYEAVNRLRRDGSAIRVVMTVHGLEPDLFDDLSQYGRGIDGAICSNRLAQRQAGLSLGSRRALYAPYGVPLATRNSAPGQRSRLRIGWVGRVEEWQKRALDIPRILDELLRRGVDFTFVVAGDGPELSALRAACSGEDLRARVTFLGNVPPDVVARDVYSNLDVLLVTSYWETGPIVVWEAMSRGIVVVSSRYIGSVSEGALAEHENCLLFDIGDARQAAACIAACQDTGLGARLGHAAREMVKGRYSRSASISAWDEALRAVLGCAPRPAGPVRHVPRRGGFDKLFGPRLAEPIRAMLGRNRLAADAGEEWPHSYGLTARDDSGYWARLAALERASPQGLVESDGAGVPAEARGT